MGAYLSRRLLYSLPTVLLLTLFVFSAVRILPGDVLMANLAETGFVTENQIEAFRKEMGLDEPFAKQYLVWLSQVLRADLGESLATGRSVWDMLGQAYPVTLELGLLSLLVSLVIGLPLGVLAGLKRNSPVDYLGRAIAVAGITVPGFVVAMSVLLVGARYFEWIPPSTYRPLYADPVANLTQFLVPSAILGYELAAIVMRMARSAVLEVMHEDYVRTARAKGLTERRVLLRHVVRNAMNPVVTVVGLQMVTLLGGIVIIESIFGLPGVGLLLVDGVTQRDYPVVQAVVLTMGIGVIAVNLVVDLAYAALDPRIRYG